MVVVKTSKEIRSIRRVKKMWDSFNGALKDYGVLESQIHMVFMDALCLLCDYLSTYEAPLVAKNS